MNRLNSIPNGHWEPFPITVNLLFDRRYSVNDLAKSVNDGCFILYNDRTKNFDIWSRTEEGVLRAKIALINRQLEIFYKYNQDRVANITCKRKSMTTEINMNPYKKRFTK